MEKNKGKVCKFCNKSFSSGKAMGGHMRSHFSKLSIPIKSKTNNQALENSAELIHCPTQYASSLTSHPQKEPLQNFRSLKRNFFSFLETSKRESEFGFCPKTPTRKRSKCHRKFIPTAKMNVKPKQVSSKSDSLIIEKVARSLLMLSKDKWPESKGTGKQKMKETNKMEARDKENGKDELVVQTQSQAKFKCKGCSKTFQSYQALGGHRANHNKKENICQEGGDFNNCGSDKNSVVVYQKVFKCPHCFKVFKSARALGRHKKVHFSKIMTVDAQTTTNQFSGKLVVDLNFSTHKEDEEVSCIEFLTMFNEE